MNTEEAKHLTVTAVVELPDGTTQTVTWVSTKDKPVEVEFSPGTEAGWLRWGPLGAPLPTIP